MPRVRSSGRRPFPRSTTSAAGSPRDSPRSRPEASCSRWPPPGGSSGARDGSALSRSRARARSRSSGATPTSPARPAPRPLCWRSSPWPFWSSRRWLCGAAPAGRQTPRRRRCGSRRGRDDAALPAVRPRRCAPGPGHLSAVPRAHRLRAARCRRTPAVGPADGRRPRGRTRHGGARLQDARSRRSGRVAHRGRHARRRLRRRAPRGGHPEDPRAGRRRTGRRSRTRRRHRCAPDDLGVPSPRRRRPRRELRRASEQRGLRHVVAGGRPGVGAEFGEGGRLPPRVAILVDELRADALHQVGVFVHEPEHPAVLALQRGAEPDHLPGLPHRVERHDEARRSQIVEQVGDGRRFLGAERAEPLEDFGHGRGGERLVDPLPRGGKRRRLRRLVEEQDDLAGTRRVGAVGQRLAQRVEAVGGDEMIREARVHGVGTVHRGPGEAEVLAEPSGRAPQQPGTADVGREANPGLRHGELRAFGDHTDRGMPRQTDTAAHRYPVGERDHGLRVLRDHGVHRVLASEELRGLLRMVGRDLA
ncbi:unnamed protein product, partial [Penicillium discolor]